MSVPGCEADAVHHAEHQPTEVRHANECTTAKRAHREECAARLVAAGEIRTGAARRMPLSPPVPPPDEPFPSGFPSRPVRGVLRIRCLDGAGDLPRAVRATGVADPRSEPPTSCQAVES